HNSYPCRSVNVDPTGPRPESPRKPRRRCLRYKRENENLRRPCLACSRGTVHDATSACGGIRSEGAAPHGGRCGLAPLTRRSSSASTPRPTTQKVAEMGKPTDSKRVARR